MLSITKATLDDVPDLAAIHIRSWEAAYTGIIPDERIREIAEKRPGLWRDALSKEHDNYIARLGGVPVGLAMMMPCRDADLPEAGEIVAFYLHPDFWGQGHARELMDFAISLLRKQGYSIISVWVLEENLRARRFYEKCGFTADGTKNEVPIGARLVDIRYRISF